MLHPYITASRIAAKKTKCLSGKDSVKGVFIIMRGVGNTCITDHTLMLLEKYYTCCKGDGIYLTTPLLQG